MRQNFSMWHMKPVHSPCGGDGVGAHIEQCVNGISTNGVK